MINSWKVQWKEEGKFLFKKFDDDKPTRAVAFGKELKSRGIVVVDVISRRRAFPPPLNKQESPRPGLLWCPYCVKWREFEEAAVVTGELTGPSLMRCLTCTISVKDAYVRMYNPDLVIQYEMRMEMRHRQKEATKLKKKGGLVPTGGLRLRR